MKDFKALGAIAAEQDNRDMTKAQAGGGDYEPPKAGFCLLRLVGYFEIGKQAGTYQGKPTLKDMVQIVLEVSGPNHPPTIKEDGTKVPHRITIEENYSLNEKARFFKLFQRMNYKGEAQHMVQLMGEPFKGSIIHRAYKGRDGKERIAVELWDKVNGTWTIEPPRFQPVDAMGMPTGDMQVIKVEPAITELKAFLWNHSDLADWSSLFIEGEYPERKNDKGEVVAKARSKNVIQNKIKSAANFAQSPIYALIAAAGGNLDIPEVDAIPEQDEEAGEAAATPAVPEVVKVPEGEAADDALNGVI